MPGFHFRLQVLLDRRLDTQKQAEETLAGRKKELMAERQTLKSLEEEVRKVSGDLAAKRSERAAASTQEGFRFGNQNDFLLALKLDLQATQAAVLSQQLLVEQAEEAVRGAQDQADFCRKEVDVLTKYRQQQEERFYKDAAYLEEIEQDEIGNVMYLGRQKKQ